MDELHKLRYYSSQRSFIVTLPRKLVKGFGWGKGTKLKIEPEFIKINGIEVVTGNLVLFPKNYPNNKFQKIPKKLFLAMVKNSEIMYKDEKKYKKKYNSFSLYFKNKYKDFFKKKHSENIEENKKELLIGIKEAKKIEKKLKILNKDIMPTKKGKPATVIDWF